MFTELLSICVTLASSADIPLPGTPVIGKSAVTPSWTGGMLDFGIKTTSDAYTDGHFSITAPVFNSMGAKGTLGGSLVFVEPYISWGEQGEVATSLGIGFRHLFNNQPLSALQERHSGWLDEGIMLGGSAFLDMLDTTSNNRFWQLGIGVEFSTRYFEVRGNYYQPLTGRKEGDPILRRSVQRETFLTSGKEPFARGHTIQQDVTFTTYDFYTDRLYRYYEEGMKGWDLEAAVMVPWLDKYCELWLVGGYGDFQNKPFGPQIGGTGEMHGFKAGVEFRPLPQVVMSATWYEDKRFQGGDWMYGLSLQIPLDPEPDNRGKSWWRKLKDSLHPRSRHLAERAVVPVHRQNAAVKIANSIGVPEVKQYSKEVSSKEKRLIVRDDVIFVNNGGNQGNGIAAHGTVEDGSAEHPYDTIVEGSELAVSPSFQRGKVATVYVTGGAGDYTEMITGESIRSSFLLPGASIHYVSGGYGVPCFDSHVFGLGQPARVAPGVSAFAGYSVWLTGSLGGSSVPKSLHSAWVEGFNIVGNVFIFADDIHFRNNSVITSKGIAVTVTTADARISGNLIVGESGLLVRAFTQTGTSYVSIENNSVHLTGLASGRSYGVEIEAIGSRQVIEAQINGNQIYGTPIGFNAPFNLNNAPTILLSSTVSNFAFDFADPFSPSQLSPRVIGSLLINNKAVTFHRGP